MKYVSTSEIPLPACWKFVETVFSVDNVHQRGGQDTRREGRELEMLEKAIDYECKLKTLCLTQLTSGSLSHTLANI